MFNRNLLITAILLLVMASFLMAGTSPNQAARPNAQQAQLAQQNASKYTGKMELSDDIFDFGYLPLGSKVSHTFWLKNIGLDTLEIVNVKPGCGCTKMPLKKRLLGVGDSTEIEIIFSAGNRRAGGFAKSPRLYTSDPNVTETTIRLKGNICDPQAPEDGQLLEFEPYGLYALIPKHQNEYSISVKNISDQDLEMKLVSDHPDCMQVKLPNGKLKAGKSKDIKVKLVDPEKYATSGFETSFTIQLSDSKNTRYSIPVVYTDSEPKTAQRDQHSSIPDQNLYKTPYKTKTGAAIQSIPAGTRSK